MNLTKFQICVNHENPSIVKAGLDEFISQVLEDHQSLDFFDSEPDDRKSFKAFFSGTVPNKLLDGLLDFYFQSSPHAEEFFVLWKLPQRDLDAGLCVSHTKALIVLIHFIQSMHHKRNLVKRLLYECNDELFIQLRSKHEDVVDVTYMLLVTIARSSPEDWIREHNDFISNIETLLSNRGTLFRVWNSVFLLYLHTLSHANDDEAVHIIESSTIFKSILEEGRF